MMYYLDPTPDCTDQEAHAILTRPQHEFWRKEEIPKGCERHFVEISEERIAELLRERAEGGQTCHTHTSNT